MSRSESSGGAERMPPVYRSSRQPIIWTARDSIHRHCVASGVPFFFKQWGGKRKDLTGRKFRDHTFDEMPLAARRVLAVA